MKELVDMTEVELLQTQSAVIAELRRRGVVKTKNSPIGDYTEWLVSNRLGLTVEASSRASFDAVDSEGIRYQIKGRCSEESRVQFSAIRNLEQQGFDFVIAVIFHEDYSVRLAVKISHDAVSKLVRYQSHTNGNNLILTNKVVAQDGVEEITNILS